MSDQKKDTEANRITKRAGRYAKVGSGIGMKAAGFAARQVFGRSGNSAKEAADLARILGNLKGPMMKVAQLLSTIPDALPPEFAEELSRLQSHAPPMGTGFVKRRMRAELGTNWQTRYQTFDLAPTAAASLGQVHKAVLPAGDKVAAKLQYPDMASVVEADITQLKLAFSLYKRMRPAIDASEILPEISERIREELDYQREARHMAAYAEIFSNDPLINIPATHANLSTERLLTMSWLEGEPMLSFKEAPKETRNRLATAMFKAWWHPFIRYGLIHGDPHLGNYTVFGGETNASGINLLDFGCVRIFPARFVKSVMDLYQGLLHDDKERLAAAYQSWGFKNLSSDLIDILNIWAKFIYGPLLDNRVRTIADGISPGEYGRKQAFAVRKALQEKGPITIPREFVFMDRAAIGLGSVFLHLQAELNFYELFNADAGDFDEMAMQERQNALLSKVGLNPPE